MEWLATLQVTLCDLVRPGARYPELTKTEKLAVDVAGVALIYGPSAFNCNFTTALAALRSNDPKKLKRARAILVGRGVLEIRSLILGCIAVESLQSAVVFAVSWNRSGKVLIGEEDFVLARGAIAAWSRKSGKWDAINAYLRAYELDVPCPTPEQRAKWSAAKRNRWEHPLAVEWRKHRRARGFRPGE